MKSSVVEPPQILLTGSARSGTSILYSLIASFKGVEAEYEPRSLYDLIGISQFLKPPEFQKLWNSYFLYSVGIDNLAGRRLNLNKADESSALKYLPRPEIRRRLSRSLGLEEGIAEVQSSRLFVKMPDLIPMINRIPFPDQLSVIFVGRQPGDVIASLLRKGWFSDRNVSSPIFSSRMSERGDLPIWIHQEKYAEFLESSELQRAVQYYIVMHSGPRLNNLALMVDYERLTRSTSSILEQMKARLDLEQGLLSKRVIQSIRITEHTDLASLGVGKKQRVQLEEIWATWVRQEEKYYE